MKKSLVLAGLVLGLGMCFTSAKTISVEAATSKYTFEAESGTFTGTPTGEKASFVYASTMTNSDHEVSGGKLVRYWGTKDNTITWKFSLNEGTKKSTFTLWVAAKTDFANINGLAISVNGQAATWTSTIVQTSGSYLWYFVGLEGKTAFATGNNELVLKNVNGGDWKVDCLEVNFPTTTVVSAYDETKPLGEFPSSGGGTTSSKGFLHMEAEHATKAEGTINDGADSFFEDADEASNGACVCHWGKEGDNILYYEFTTSAAVESATIKFAAACTNGDNREWADLIIPRINGGSGGAAPFDRYPGVNGINITSAGTNGVNDDFYNFVEVETPSVSLKAGENVFELESFSGFAVNIDYIEIYTDEDVMFSFVPTDNGVGGSAGPVTMEAESAIVEGTSSDSAGVDGMILERTSSNPDEHATSGGACVGNFAKAGNKITWNFSASSDCSVTLDFWVASAFGGATDISSVMSVTLNDEEVTWETAGFPAYPGNDQWYKWVKISTEDVSVKAGANTLVLTNTSGSSFNIDCVTVNAPDSVIIRQGSKNSDTVAPEISIIYFKTIGIETYKELEFTFTVTDNKSDEDNISVSVRVFYAYGTDQQKTISCRNNKFTPEELGEYTIVVTATDEKDNEATAKRILIVDKEGTKPVNPTPDNPTPTKPDNGGGEDVHYVDTKVVGGWVTFGSCLSVSAALIAYMIIKSKKVA